MSEHSQGVLSAARLALAIKRFREERPDADLLSAEPIAVVGIGCRMPGKVKSPEDFWQILKSKTDTVTEIPADRWVADDYYSSDAQAPGKTNCRWGGFVEDIAMFDPVLFGISPREAASIDPQQRLLLEVAWEAIQDSGRAPESLAGSRTGVFVGVALSDYERFALEDSDSIHANTCTGSYRSVMSGRLAFLLDARGPSVSLDTACSSSLVAIHSACQSLRSRESDFALAGGVNLHLLPEHYIGLSRMGMLSPEGRCKTFDAKADGFVPGEGCGVVALKRLTDALLDEDRIYAVIRGSAVNQDGRSSSLTAPSGLAQQEVIAAALRSARVPASRVSYVETHGTGTVLGDPIEVEAIAAVLGAREDGAPECVLGAAKSNFGHLEAAAGITGFIKAILALHHEEIPANLHYEELNPHISLDGTRLRIATEASPWKRTQTPRFAGVSSFGFSGTNAHIVLEESPRLPARPAAPSDGERLLQLSARTPAALRDVAQSYHAFLSDRSREIPLYDVCHAAATQRSSHEERLAIAGATHVEMREGIEDFLAGRPRPGMAAGRVAGNSTRIVFVCSGQGSQYAGMGLSLFEKEPVFRGAMEECAAKIHAVAGWSLLEELAAPEAESKLARTEYAQPAIFAIQVAIARLLGSWGVTPAAVIGHSVGEIAAAYLAGALDLNTCARIAVARGRVMASAAGKGCMAAVRLPVAEVLQALGNRSGVSIAAVNGPQSTVISGDKDAIAALLQDWKGRGISCTLMPANYAFHSAQMEPFATELAKELGEIRGRTSEIPIFSTVLGGISPGTSFGAAYWSRNVRATVQFSAALQKAIASGFSAFVELAPQPVLAGSISEHSMPSGEPVAAVGTLRRNHAECRVMLGTLGQLHILGYPVSWKALYPQSTPPLPLPVYPYQRQRFWFERRSVPRTVGVQTETENIWQPEWQPLERGAAVARRPRPSVVVASDVAERAALTAALSQRGISISGVTPEEWSRSVDADGRVIWIADKTTAEDANALPTFLNAVQSLIRNSPQSRLQFWVVTQGAIATPETRSFSGLFQSPLWGMLRSIAMEHPSIAWVRVDLDEEASDFGTVAEEILKWDGEEEIALHGGRRYVRRLEKCDAAVKQAALRLRADATYLITGGLGAIGLRVAEWLAAKGAGNVILIGRHGPKAETRARIHALHQRGVRVEARCVDVADDAQMRGLLTEIAEKLPPLAGIFHAAGVLDDGAFLDQTTERIDKVMAPKVKGAWNLHKLTEKTPLDFFVFFSSIASLTGSPGQSGYAAANAFLDALARARRANGLTALSVNWGAWAGDGMAEQVSEAGRRRVLPGLRSMDPERCFTLLERALGMDQPQLVIADSDWSQWRAAQQFLSSVAAGGEVYRPSSGSGVEILQTLATAAPARRKKILVNYLRDLVSALLGFDASGLYIDETQSLLRLGMDSLMALEFRNALALTLGRSLSATLVFDHPSLADVADYLLASFWESDALSPSLSEEMKDLESLSDAEAEELLKAELKRI